MIGSAQHNPSAREIAYPRDRQFVMRLLIIEDDRDAADYRCAQIVELRLLDWEKAIALMPASKSQQPQRRDVDFFDLFQMDQVADFVLSAIVGPQFAER